jgi:tRNA1Val (adenine37-N6)-methyltransferase
MSTITTDTFFQGRLSVQQAQAGYRFSIDAVLLAHFIHPLPGETVIDLGTGCGIIPLMLAFRHPQVTLLGIEIQATLADLAVRNVVANGLQDRITILNQDLKDLTTTSLAPGIKWVLSNPPFRKINSGRLNPHAQKAIARHEIRVDLESITAVASRLLSPGGRFASVYPAERLADLLTCMRAVQLEPKQMRMVHSREDSEAKLILVEGIKGGQPGLRVRQPLIIYAAKGTYTAEVNAMMA